VHAKLLTIIIEEDEEDEEIIDDEGDSSEDQTPSSPMPTRIISSLSARRMRHRRYVGEKSVPEIARTLSMSQATEPDSDNDSADQSRNESSDEDSDQIRDDDSDEMDAREDIEEVRG
jgi:hypothetical protein